MDIRSIKNERDHERALRRVEALWDAPDRTAASDELDVLATLIEAYEHEHYPIDCPSK
jgi:HTH-type transcriptional regulator/antitoxin HigA